MCVCNHLTFCLIPITQPCLAKYLTPNMTHDFNVYLTLTSTAKCCYFHYSLPRIAIIKLVEMCDQRLSVVWVVSKYRRPVSKVAQTNAPIATHPSGEQLPVAPQQLQLQLHFGYSLCYNFVCFVCLCYIAIHSIISVCFCAAFPACLPQFVAVAHRRRSLLAKIPTLIPTVCRAVRVNSFRFLHYYWY